MTAGGGVERSLKWLAEQQEPTGGFSGYAGSSISNLKPERQHDTIFFTALILVCLEGIKGNETITRPAVEFLKSNRSELGWNYWAKHSPQAAEMPFPDDLDDTAYVLLAISKYQSEYVDGRVLAEMVKLLLASEVNPGGPYRTWLVAPSLHETWGDVDLAVNANIGALLAQHRVKMPALEAYIDQNLLSAKLQSSYYIGEIPILYFLARWYRGAQLERLKQRVGKAMRVELKRPNALGLAMLISAGCRLGAGKNDLNKAVEKLALLKKADHWPAEALYPEPIVKGVQYYAGSEALTTAFALEALQAYEMYGQQAKARIETSDLLLETPGLKGEIKRAYLQAASKIISGPARTQIATMADITARAYRQRINPSILRGLNQGSINGWIAYSIYDDFYDQEAEPADLALANYAARRSQAGYLGAVTDKKFQALVHETFNIMDTANRWEVLHARARIDKERLHYTLPNYSRYQKLAERSWGHMLASTGVLISMGCGLESSQSRHLRRFFHHFLIARQLNDDAHDWLEDLNRGHLSAVNCLLLEEFGQEGVIKLSRQEGQLKLKFWQQTIFQVNELIRLHLGKARRALKRADMKDGREFQSWLDALEAASIQAVQASRQAQNFIETYKINPNN